MSDKIKLYQVKAGEFVFSLEKKDVEHLDMVEISPDNFHLIKDNSSVTAQVIDADISGKKLRVELEGEVFEITIRDELDLVLDRMGFGVSGNKHLKEIKAPMPGLVLEIAVSGGQEVNEGDRILILEAMKMENIIVVNTSARIKKIAVEAGQAVEKGQVLVELE